jgi:hypothetical protein
VFFSDAANRPECILQAAGERHVALAAENDFGVAPAGVGQRKLIEPPPRQNSCRSDMI